MEDIKYKFFATGNSGTREVFPKNGNTLLAVWEKEQERAVFHLTLKGKMLFDGDDFHWLNDLEHTQYRCDPVSLQIQKNCNGVFSDYILARLILNKGDWNPDQCIVTIEASVNDRYTCYNDGKDVEYNLFELIPSDETVNLLEGEIESLFCSGHTSTAGGGDPTWCGTDDQTLGWVIQKSYTIQDPPVEGEPPGYSFQITYIREFVIADFPLPAPWIHVEGLKYVRPPALYGYRSFGGLNDYGYEWKYGGTIDNGMNLYDVVQGLVTLNCPGKIVKSNFFDWNAIWAPYSNLVNPIKASKGFIIDVDGVVQPDPDPFNIVTDFIRVQPGNELWVNDVLSSLVVRGAFYDANKTLISVATAIPGHSTPIKIADIPAGVFFVRYQYFGISENAPMLYVGTEATDYTAYVNYASGKPSTVSHLKFFQKSDVKRPGVSGDATQAVTTIEKMINDLCNFFQLNWDIDEDGFFVLEHVSFFQKGVGLNLVGRFDEAYRVGTNQYSYDLDNMPRKETFQIMDDSQQYGDFKGFPILYNTACAGEGASDDKSYNVENFMTDVLLCLTNSASDSVVVSDDGFVLIATDGEGHILSEAPLIGGNIANNVLSWAHIHEDYWRWNRVFNQFTMNNAPRNALSVVPTKKQIKINVQICCGDVFDPAELITTGLGNGAVASAEYDLHKEILTLELLYVAEDALIVNFPPVAGDDDAITWKNLTIDIDVLANDTDPDGTINPATLEIIFPPSHGVASVVANKIRYTPATDYVGNDTIVYRVKDDYSEPSNNGTITITVKPGSPLPIASDDTFTTASNHELTVGNVLDNDTGDGDITADPETKATTAGGTVQIFINGSFIYNPATDYVGADRFDYTLRDSNNNTDTGTAHITVFEASDIYVSYFEDNNIESDLTNICSGGPQVVGTENKIDQHWLFWSDALGTIPLDVSGYGLQLSLHTVEDVDGTPFPSDTIINVTGGTGYDRLSQLKTQHSDGCDGTEDINTTFTYTLNSSPDYIIL